MSALDTFILALLPYTMAQISYCMAADATQLIWALATNNNMYVHAIDVEITDLVSHDLLFLVKF